jgi:hypothetical protein
MTAGGVGDHVGSEPNKVQRITKASAIQDWHLPES